MGFATGFNRPAGLFLAGMNIPAATSFCGFGRGAVDNPGCGDTAGVKDGMEATVGFESTSAPPRGFEDGLWVPIAGGCQVICCSVGRVASKVNVRGVWTEGVTAAAGTP